jgi:uroporphyrinogen-III synthase
MLPVLLTRPRPDAEALAGRLADTGARIVLSPLIEIRVADRLPELGGGLILTSPNGVAAFRALGGPRGLPVWCVGPRTAALAAAHGLEVRDVAKDAAALAGAVPPDAPRLMHLRGRHARGDLARALRARGIEAGSAVIYDQAPVPLSDEGRAVLRAGPVLAPLYSPRSARLLRTECPPVALGNVRAVCLSPAVARAAPFDVMGVAERPDGAAMEAVVRTALATIGG